MSRLAGTPAKHESSVPYLRTGPPKEARDGARTAAQRPLKVGLAPSGGAWNPKRSILLSDLHPLCESRNIEFFSLQRGAEASRLGPVFPSWRITDLEDGPADIARTAAAILGLDLVISVDTMIAHLAGALAKPVWTLLPYAADWRWLTKREDRPWYPTMRIFRQGPDRTWNTPVRRLVNELARLSHRVSSEATASRTDAKAQIPRKEAPI
ncbi:MAG: glycosyltransferase family 9 protein [Terriglobia bacterium]